MNNIFAITVTYSLPECNFNECNNLVFSMLWVVGMETKYETEKKDAEIQLQKALNKTQETVTWSIALVALIIITIGVLMLRLRSKQKKIVEEKNKIIEETHKELTDSINYAQNIQQAVLPKKEQLDEILGPEKYFLLFKPKHTVS